MTVSTLSTYLQISNNLTKWQTMTAAQPAVQLQTAYYQANIGSVKTPSDLVNNYRLFSYVMNAYGLGDMTSYGSGLIQKVLEQGTGSQSNLAYTLNNPQILALAQTFDFADNGSSTTSSSAVQTGVVNNYITQTLDANQGQSDPGVQLALYFQQNAPSITSVYNILADKNLLTVVQTALGISPLTSSEDIDTQANMISSQLISAIFKTRQNCKPSSSGFRFFTTKTTLAAQPHKARMCQTACSTVRRAPPAFRWTSFPACKTSAATEPFSRCRAPAPLVAAAVATSLTGEETAGNRRGNAPQSNPGYHRACDLEGGGAIHAKCGSEDACRAGFREAFRGTEGTKHAKTRLDPFGSEGPRA